MKICPNCGARMGADVNFCTNCGTDLRQVPLAKAKKEETQAKPKREEVKQNAGSRPQQEELGTAYVPKNYWDWLVHSWKSPVGEQSGQSWFGWVTILGEDLLLILGLLFDSSRLDSMGNFNGSVSRFSGSTLMIFLIYLVLVEAAWLAIFYGGYHIMYGHARSFFQFTNHVVQTSNLNVIFMVIAFLFMLTGLTGSMVAGLFIMLALAFYSTGLQVVILGDPHPVHDRFYSYILIMIVVTLATMLLTMIVGASVISTIIDTLGGSLPQF